jgi:hypothetical protein
MDGIIEQRICIKFCLKLSKSANETHDMVRETFGQHSLSRTMFFERHSRLGADGMSVEDGRRSRLPSSSKMIENIEEIVGLIYEDHRQTVREVADTVGTSYAVCQEMLTENLNMLLIAATLDK